MSNDHYDSYWDWYDNGPGSVSFNREVQKSKNEFYKSHEIIIKKKEPDMKIKMKLNKNTKIIKIDDTKGYSFCFKDKEGHDISVSVEHGTLYMSVSDVLNTDGTVLSRKYFNPIHKTFATIAVPDAVEKIEIK